LKQRKNKFIASLKESIEEGKEIDEEMSAELAQEWMTIADTDGSGTIDLDEMK